MTRSSKGLLITVVAIAVVAIAVVAIATSTTGINNTEDPKPSSGKEELARRIQISVDVAGSKNKQAVLFCDTEINTILALQFPEVERQGQKAAEDIAAYGSCCKIIYSLVRDKIDKKNTTDLYVDEQMQANLSPPLRQLSGDLETTIGRFDLLLRESTVGLAYDLAAMNPRNSAGNISLPVDLKSNNYIREALKNLGFGVVTVGIFIPLDVWEVLSTKIARTLISKIAAKAAQMFARPAAEAAAVVALPPIDGPLPIGDIIALIGTLWTAYDVYTIQKQFEREMKESMNNMVADVRRDIYKQVMDHVHAILKEHQRLQDEIRHQSQLDFGI